MKARRKEIVDVVRWFKKGDHPDVIGIPERLKKYIPVIEGATGYLYDKNYDNGIFVYPGDYIINSCDVLRPDEFESEYEIINE